MIQSGYSFLILPVQFPSMLSRRQRGYGSTGGSSGKYSLMGLTCNGGKRLTILSKPKMGSKFSFQMGRGPKGVYLLVLIARARKRDRYYVLTRGNYTNFRCA